MNKSNIAHLQPQDFKKSYHIATQNDKNYILSYQNDLERNLGTYQIGNNSEVPNFIIVEGVLIKGFCMERNVRFECPDSFASKVSYLWKYSKERFWNFNPDKTGIL